MQLAAQPCCSRARDCAPYGGLESGIWRSSNQKHLFRVWIPHCGISVKGNHPSRDTDTFGGGVTQQGEFFFFFFPWKDAPINVAMSFCFVFSVSVENFLYNCV